MSPSLPVCTLTCVIVSASIACSGQKSGGNDTASTPTATRAESPTAEPSVPTATAPANVCDWIPVADVEAILGPLEGPPTQRDGCRYTLKLPDSINAARQESIRRSEETSRRLAEVAGTEPVFPALLAPLRDPKTFAVTVSVDVTSSALADLAVSPGRSRSERAEDSPRAQETPSGWDHVSEQRCCFSGRVGHVRVQVRRDASDVPVDRFAALAARVRDRIPDRPFPVTNPYQILDQVPSDASPCGLLTRAEAEAVLGPLAVPPYRSSSEDPPLAHSQGRGCAYFTGAHRVFALTPTWSGGKQSFELEKGVGKLISLVGPGQEATIFRGPWDKAQVGMTGQLQFLKGDRLLEAHYAASTTNRAGAVKLAALALQRLAP